MAQPKTGMTRINFYLDPDVLDGYRWLAKQRKTTYSELLRTAAREHLIREVKAHRDQVQLLAQANGD